MCPRNTLVFLVGAYAGYRLPTGVALEITYGYHTTTEEDLFIQRSRAAIQRFARSTAFSLKDGFIVNWLPFRTYQALFVRVLQVNTSCLSRISPQFPSGDVLQAISCRVGALWHGKCCQRISHGQRGRCKSIEASTENITDCSI